MENTKYKVLLVEDNEIERRAFERFVESNEIPYDYVIANSVSQAERELALNQGVSGPGKKFDIVISDHDLGDGTAIDVLRFANNTPVIVVTGAGDEETAIKAWKAGAYDYLIKDLDQNYLKAIPITVENAVRHKMVEEKLQLLSGAVRSTEDSVYITNMRGEIIFVNKAFCKTYGYSEEEIVGKNSQVLWIGKNQSENTRSVFQTRSAGSGWEVGFYHKRKDDSIFPISLSRSVIKNANKNDVAIVGVARDISERLIIEDKLRAMSLKLQKRIQTQNEIAIMAIEAIQKLLAQGATDKASKVLCDFLDISKINTGAIELNRTNFDITDLITQAEQVLTNLAAEKNIKLVLSSQLQNEERRTKNEVNADYDKMAQILINLLLAAIRFAPESHVVQGAPEKNIINIAVNNTDNNLTIEIHDICLDSESSKIHKIANNAEWIKQQFHEGKEDIALGLRIAKEFIEMHGGQIWTDFHESGIGSRDSKIRSTVLCFTIPKFCVNRDESFDSENLVLTR